MLELTRQARDVVRRIPQQPGQLPSAGLRIAASPADASRLSVGSALRPRRGDAVVETDGARVFLDDSARHRLEGCVLDVATRRDGRLEFRTRRDAA